MKRLFILSWILALVIPFSGCGKKSSNGPDDDNTVTDIDGNVYQTVQIGNQIWMAENLQVTHYRNGDAIPNVPGNTEWEALLTGAYCVFDNNITNLSTYGRLYNWFAVNDPRGLAPEGWRVPTDVDWKGLEMFLGMSPADVDIADWRGLDQGAKLKETGTAHWPAPNSEATNVSGFTALPGGDRIENGSFLYLGFYTSFWTSTGSSADAAWRRHLHCNDSRIYRSEYYKRAGFSVRLVKE